MELSAKTYKVVGTLRVFETKPGDTFTAALPEEQEQRLIEGGHIEVTGAAGAPAGDTADPDTTSSQDGDTDDSASEGDDTDGDEQDQSGAAPAGERS